MYGVIEGKRQGLSKPNLIFVKSFRKEKPTEYTMPQSHLFADTLEIGNPNFKRFENQTSRGLETKLQEVGKPNPINTDYINTDISHSSQSVFINYDSIKQNSDVITKTDKTQADYETVLNAFRKNIAFDILCDYTLKRDKDLLEDIVQIMAHTYVSTKDSVVSKL